MSLWGKFKNSFHKFTKWDFRPFGADGFSVTEDTAMRVSAVYSCVRLISAMSKQLPCSIYKETDTGKEVERDSELFKLLRYQPNPWQDSVMFWDYALQCLLLRGNFLAYKNKVGSRLMSLDTIPPKNVHKVELGSDGKRIYHILDAKSNAREFSQDQIFHVVGMSEDGIVGMSPIRYNSSSIDNAYELNNHGLRLFRNGAFPGMSFEYPGKLSDDAQKRLAKQLQENFGGSKAGRPIILEQGAKVNALSLTNEDTQYIQSRKFSREEICGIYGVQPHMIGATDQAKGWSTNEAEMRNFINMTLNPWIVTIESAINTQLIDKKDWGSRYCRFNTSALLRGDTKTRSEYYQKGINWGWLNPNEVRRLEEMNDRDGGDTYLQPLNMGDSNGQEENTE